MVNYCGRDFEIRIFRDYWNEYFDSPKMLEEAQAELLRGLDSIEQKKCKTLISRMKRLTSDPVGEALTDVFFSHEEERQIIELESSMNDIKREQKEGCEAFLWNGYYLPRNAFEPSVFWYRMGLDSVRTEYLKDKCIIDAGAYIGDSSVILSEYTGESVYAFEALKDNCDLIDITARMNNRNNIKAINLAIGNDMGTVELLLREYGDVGHGIVKRNELEYRGSVEVPIMTIDDFVTNTKSKVGLIKSDIEGAEQD